MPMGIPPTLTGLPSNLAKEPVLPRFGNAKQGLTDFGTIGYDGPSIPLQELHYFIFRLFALNEKIDLHPGAIKAELEEAMNGKVIEVAETIGTFYINF